MENAKKNLVFHFGVGRQAAFYRIDYVKSKNGVLEIFIKSNISCTKILVYFSQNVD